MIEGFVFTAYQPFTMNLKRKEQEIKLQRQKY